MTLTDLQKQTCKAIVNIFETGKVVGDYGQVTLIPGDTGHLTYGRSQTTLASGNLALLIHDYCENNGEYATELEPYLSRLDKRDFRLDTDEEFKLILRRAGGDPIMQNVQDNFFDRIYWDPAIKWCDKLGITKPLGVSVIYDSCIHGSLNKIIKVTNQEGGQLNSVGEETWIKNYVHIRRNWLANHTNRSLHNTVYRMDSFKQLIKQKRWDLSLPIIVRGVTITKRALTSKDGTDPIILASASDLSERVLSLTNPYMTGPDVKEIQLLLGLKDKDADGIYGVNTENAVKEFQKKNGLKVDGKVGPATRTSLQLQQ